MIRLTLVTAAAALLLTGAAAAQTTSQSSAQPAVSPVGDPNDAKMPEGATRGAQGENSFSDPPLEPPAAGMGTTGRTSQGTANQGSMGQASSASTGSASNTSATEAASGGGPTLVANAPIPDTLENRARYGGPRSHGGRKTAPRGN